MRRIPICKIAEVPLHGLRECQANPSEAICLLNAGDRFYACQAQCPHQEVPLCTGIFDGEMLTCVEHLWQWSVRDGGEPRGLAEAPLRMFPVETDGETVYLLVKDE
jgi:toluene monooxygenase system ferredoxin subunit